MFTLEEVRALGFSVPTDEEVQVKKEEVTREEEAARVAAVEEAARGIQSLRDQLVAAEERLASLTAQG